MSSPSAAAQSFTVDEHAAVIAAIDRCADAVVESWDAASVTDGAAVVGPLRACLAEHGVLDALTDVLADAVEAAGYTLRATPVAAPPYVVVTSRGPVCRATVADGRLLLRFRAFELTDENEYVRGRSGDAMLDVDLV